MQDKVKLPAIGLIVLGALGALMAVWGMVAGGVDAEQLAQLDIPEEQKDMILKYAGGGGMVMSLLALALDAFVIWAGLQMMKLRAWGAAVAASIVVMIPCFTSCCCVLGLPLGIWSLVVLFNADVKKAFEGGAA